MKYAQHFVIYAICDAIYDDVIYLFSTTRREEKNSTCTNGNDDHYIVTNHQHKYIHTQTNKHEAKSDDFSYITEQKEETKI